MNNTQHPLDDLFRRGLADLEISPTPAGRSDFLKKAEKELDKRSNRTWWFIGSGMAVILLFIAGIILFNRGTESPQPDDRVSLKPGTATEATLNSSPEQAPASSSQFRPAPPEKNTSSSHISYSGARKSNPVFDNRSVIPAGQTDTLIPVELLAVNPLPPAEPVSGNAGFEKSAITEKNPDKTESDPPVFIPVTVNNDSTPETGEEIPKNDTIPDLKKKNRSPRAKDWNLSIGINYTPEWIFNTLDSNKFVNNFGVEGMFRFGPYSIRTGVGLSVTKGYNQVVVKTQPYLGSYHSLDYITYQWDEYHYHLVPTIHTSSKDVFDTVLQYNYYYYEKQYTYLQIPLVLGYDFPVKRKWSIGVRAGPVMSVLLKSKVLTGEYDPGKDMIITINNITPDRIHVNWQAMGGINAAYHFSPRFSFELEPDIRYYFNSVYEKKNITDKPWSLGFRAAFMIKL